MAIPIRTALAAIVMPGAKPSPSAGRAMMISYLSFAIQRLSAAAILP